MHECLHVLQAPGFMHLHTEITQQDVDFGFVGQRKEGYLLFYSFYRVVDGSLVFQRLNAQSQGVMGLS